MHGRVLALVSCLLAASVGTAARAQPEAPAPREASDGIRIESPGRGAARISDDAAHLELVGREATLRLGSVGRGGARHEVRASSAAALVEDVVRSDRGEGITEWWRALPSGLEHGVTLARRPEGRGALRLGLLLGGALHPEPLTEDAIALLDAAGARVATYSGLVVLDADGITVPARMSVEAGRIVIEVDDAGARYPLVVDPLIVAEEAILAASGTGMGARFGDSVAVSDDELRVAVTSPADDTFGTDRGAVRVFVRTAATWTLEATLPPPAGTGGFGYGGVSFSLDASRLLVGHAVPDQAVVFVRSGSSWSQEAVLMAPDGIAGDAFGSAVALTDDGGLAVVGAYADDTASGVDSGSAHVFVRAGSTWTHQAVLLAPDAAAGDAFGTAVTVARTGANRIIVGARLDDSPLADAGSAHVFVLSGGTWVPEAMLVAPDPAAGDRFGYQVSLDGSGARVIVGVPLDDTTRGYHTGSARIFVRAGTAWSQEATLLAPDGAPSDQLGVSVFMARHGGLAVAGAYLDDTPAGNGGSARVFYRTGSVWSHEATLIATDVEANDFFGWSVAVGGGARVVVGGNYYESPTSATDVGSVRVFQTSRAPNGEPCGVDAACMSYFCVDGVCCNERCGGGTSDCQACAAALTGGPNGTCAALSAAVAPTVVCHASSGGCDPETRCEASSRTCSNAISPASTVCRPAVSACDLEEVCDGVSAACPADTVHPAGDPCRPAAGECDVAETCDGTNICPPDVRASRGTVCRPSVGGCDPAEACDGTSAGCPADDYSAPGTVCGGSVPGSCSSPGRCAVGNPLCPDTTPLPAGTVCQPADPTNPCDLDDVCDGASQVCAPAFASSTTVCGPAPSGVCDAPDHCSGTSADCEATFNVGVECRTAADTCDLPEICGSSPDCPADSVAAAGLSCRASTAACDPEEVCDGEAVTCPSDETTCVMTDVGPGVDAGTPPTPTAGCRCAVASSSRGGALAAVGLLVAALGWRRARRGATCERCRST